MIMQLPYMIASRVEKVILEVMKKKDLKALPKMRFENFHEGHAAQILHIGPFLQEGPAIAMAPDFMARGGCTLRGKHHETYLSDFRRTAPEKLKTVIRQPLNLPRAER